MKYKKAKPIDLSAIDKATEEVKPIPEEVKKPVEGLVSWPRHVNLPPDTLTYPTDFARTSLFGLPQRATAKEKELLRALEKVRKTKDERLVLREKNKELASRGDVEICYSGPRLTIAHQTTWLLLVSKLREKRYIGDVISISATEILRELKMSSKGRNYKTIVEHIDDLMEAIIKIRVLRPKSDGKSKGWVEFSTHLIQKNARDDQGRMVIQLDPEIAKVFDRESYQPLSVRLKLSDQGKALLNFVCSHQNGKSNKAELKDLHAWFDSRKRMREFRNDIKNALAELEHHGVLKASSINSEDNVSWTRLKIQNTYSF